MQVVRTRRVRAIEERFYGRTARMFYVGVERSADGDDMPRDFNDFEVAAAGVGRGVPRREAVGIHPPRPHLGGAGVGVLGAMAELVAEFDQLPRSGETMYGFAVGVYPTDHPTLPSGTSSRILGGIESEERSVQGSPSHGAV